MRSLNIVRVLVLLPLALTACKNDGTPAPAAPAPPAPAATYTIGGNVAGLNGSVTLANNGGDARTVSASGAFTFATALAGGSAYAVTVTTQPVGQTCAVASGTGSVAAANVTGVTVTCTNNSYTIGGTVQGLTGSVVLANNGGDARTVSADGAFTFATAILNGATYAVTITTQPAGQSCILTGASGTVAAANVTGVTVSCTTNPAGTTAILGKLGASWEHTCALRDDGKAACWGYNSSGQLGTGNYNINNTPFVVNALSGVTWVDAGNRASCAVFGSAGNVACSGDGLSNTFVNVSDGSGDFAGAQSVALGEGFKCLVTTTGALKCWGTNSAGQLANGAPGSSLTPIFATGQPLPGCGPGPCATGLISTGVVQVVAASNHGCLLTIGGYVQCWGASDAGATSFAVTKTAAENVLGGVTSLDTGDNHTCAVMTDQTVQCWGRNAEGQLGLGSGGPASSLSPMTVPGLTGVVALTAGDNHTCALRTNGKVSCWGAGNTVDAHLAPFEYSMTGIVAIAGGFNHTCALRTNKTIVCWGSGSDGQMGTGSSNGINGGPNPNVGTVSGGAVFWGP